jgi:tRNA(Ile)-lysidine synthase
MVRVAHAGVRHRFERHVAALARSRRLFAEGDHLLVAVSGGPDSVALLSVLVALAPSMGLTLSALHVNYGLRGEESDEDQRFVSRLCGELGVPLTCERIMLTGSTRGGQSLQARAREARYAVMRRAATACDASKIALGHTADDQAETLLMWMLRGAGAAGMAGIPPVRDAVYVRPLLDVSRADVLAYLKAKGLAFRTDSSNERLTYRRNRIRHEVLPLLKRLNPSIVQTLTRQAAILRDEDACLEQWVSEWIGRTVSREGDRTMTVPRAALLDLPIALQRRVIRRLLREVTGAWYGPSFRATEAVLEKVVCGRSGSSLTLRGVRVVRDYQGIKVIPAGAAGCQASGEPSAGLRVGVPSVTLWPPTGHVISLRFGRAASEEADGPAGRQVAWFDADRFTHQLEIRSWRAGDVFHPQGMGGHRKKLQDYFSDVKLPRARRSAIPLLAAPEGILWVVGYRTDHRFRVTPSTKRVMVAEVWHDETGGAGK